MKANIKNDYDVFANFQKNENYPLYSLNRNDLAYFFDLLNKFYLEYKNFINIGSNILFGLELEYAYKISEYYNNDIIEARLLEPKVSKNDLEKYRLINTRSALELADLIFNNNEDKIYFLRQYFKNFEIANDNSYYLAKQFTVIR